APTPFIGHTGTLLDICPPLFRSAIRSSSTRLVAQSFSSLAIASSEVTGHRRKRRSFVRTVTSSWKKDGAAVPTVTSNWSTTERRKQEQHGTRIFRRGRGAAQIARRMAG